MSTDKKALALTGIAIGFAVVALISFLSLSNGQLRQEIKSLKNRSGGQIAESSEKLDSVEKRLKELDSVEREVKQLDRQVQENVNIANDNYDKYNRLVVLVDSVVDDIKGTSKARVLKAIEKIKSDDIKLDGHDRMNEERSG